MANPGLIKNYYAGAAISPRRIVKHGADDEHVVQGAAATDSLMGVTGELGAAAAEDRIDIIKSGIAEVEFGGTVTRGGPLTTDASGRAVAAAPAAGSNVRIVGFAEVSAVVGDIGPFLLSPGVMQG